MLLDAGNEAQPSQAGDLALRRFAGALVDALPGLAARPEHSDFGWALQYDETAADADSCHRLLGVLERLASGEHHAAAVTALIAQPQVFDPGRVLVPALQALCAGAERGGTGRDAQRLRLWRHCCAFLLARSEMPPAAPRDWSQPAALACPCEDCQALQVFAQHPQLPDKTRESYRRQCRQHAEDIAAMRALQALAVAAPDADRARLAAAVARQPQAVED